MLQLVDPSTMKLDDILEDVVIFLDSWEYPTDFMITQTKYFLGSYPLFFGRPWLETVDDYIGCRSRSMTISDRNSTMQLKFFPPSKLIIETEKPICVDGQ